MSTPIPPEEQFYDTKKVADIFSVTPETIVAWCKRGLFKNAICMNKRWRIPRQSVIDMANSKYGGAA